MTIFDLASRFPGFLQLRLSKYFGKRCLELRPDRPIVSFAFDDFPLTAFRGGGAILEKFGLAGTYYVALHLLGRLAPVGRIISADELKEVVAHGHELGCHTFAHCHAMNTKPRVYEESILDNRQALAQLLPGQVFKTHAYPISSPRPGTKSRAGRYFSGCRGGGQTFNAGRADLNRLNGFFLEKTGGSLAAVQETIEQTCRACGWLILATHDVCEKPSRFGCTPAFFEEIARLTVNSGARILPVGKAMEVLNPAFHGMPSNGQGRHQQPMTT